LKKLASALALFLAGCGSTGVVRLGSSVPAPKPEDCALDIVAAESDVKRPFEKVCMIDAKTGSTLYHHRTPEAAMKRMKKAACECGADAVILTGVEKTGVNLMTWGSSETKGIAIRYLAEPAK